MSNIQPLHWYTFLSRTTLDWSCPRKRWWGYHALGRGLQSPHLGLELFLGQALHDGLAAIATQWQDSKSADIDDIATKTATSVRDLLAEGGLEENVVHAHEQAALVEGLLRGFYRHQWMNLISEYPKVIAVEKEVSYPLGEHMTFECRPDLILGNDDAIVYVEHKSTSSKSSEWVNQWNSAVQLHSTVKAIEHTLGITPTAVIVSGLFKGFRSYGKQSSVMCYGYHRQGTPPFSYPETLYEYRSGFKRFPTWEMEGGVKKWVDEMPDRILADIYPCTPPIFVNERLIADFFAQRTIRETEIKEAVKVINDPDMPVDMRKQFLNGFFPQVYSECSPGFGRPCGFKELCFGNVEDPLSRGWTLREPHFALEAEQLARLEQQEDAQL